MKAQGYGVKDNVLFQDNTNSILLEKNGKASRSNHTKHINILYFFITDRVSKEELSVLLCPTGDMIGDYTTKPLKRDPFRNLSKQIMGVTPARDLGPGKTDIRVRKTETSNTTPSKCKVKSLVPPDKKATPQECVGSQSLTARMRIPGL
jgi:hypothetical protein